MKRSFAYWKRVHNTVHQKEIVMKQLKASLVALVLSAPAIVVASNAAASDSFRDSIYTGILFDEPETSAREGNCTVVEYFPDHGSFLKEKCATVSGMTLNVVNSDARERITLKRDGEREFEFILSNLHGGAFNSLSSDVVEWRGMRIGGRFVADSLIVRSTSVAMDPDLPRNSEYLAVVRFDANGACLIGSVDTRKVPHANAAARVIADSAWGCP
jgi:hypothetical protein